MDRNDFKKTAAEYFDSRTPEDPAYWATNIFDIYDVHYERMLSKRGAEETKRLEAMEWQDVLREYVRWWIKGMSMLHVVDTYFNTGNGSPYQYGWYPHGFGTIATKKVIDKFVDQVKIEDPKTDGLNIGPNFIFIERNLGYGHSINRRIGIGLDFDLSRAGGKIRVAYKANVKCSGQAGFHDDFVEIAKDMQAELDQLKKDPLFKIDLSEYDTYPDVSQYKDKHDQLGIINAHVRWDTIGTGSKARFSKNYIAAYKEASEYCPGVPRVEYSDDLLTCVYSGKRFTAGEVEDICCERVPDALGFITQGVQEVLIHKYGLLPTVLENSFSPDEPIKSHVYWIHDQYHMPIDKDLQDLIDKYKVKL